jgi:hypothetical protein
MFQFISSAHGNRDRDESWIEGPMVVAHCSVRAVRVVALALVLATGSTALAQPVTRVDQVPCTVRVVLAPAEVRAEIEAWVRAEPRCERELEVRVVAAKDGYYLSARDGEGHVRERIVPDVQSVAVLVVSWMADDSIGPTLPDAAASENASASAAPPVEAPVVALPASEPDSEAPLLDRPSIVHRRDREARGRHWLTLGAIGSPDGQIGARGQIDVLGGGRWTLGVAGGWRGGDRDHRDDMNDGRMHPNDGTADAGIYVGATQAVGPIVLRAQLGLGMDIHVMDNRMGGPGPMIRPALDAGVFAGVRLGDSWGLVGGPVLEAPLGEGAGPAGVAAFVGVQYGL